MLTNKLEQARELLTNLHFKHPHQVKAFDKDAAHKFIDKLEKFYERGVVLLQCSDADFKRPLRNIFKECEIKVDEIGFYYNIVLA